MKLYLVHTGFWPCIITSSGSKNDMHRCKHYITFVITQWCKEFKRREQKRLESKVVFYSFRTLLWCSILFIDNSSCEGPCNLQRYNTALHPQHFSASFTTKWILLLASFGYYWQLEGIKNALCCGSDKFLIQPKMGKALHSQKHKWKTKWNGKLLTIWHLSFSGGVI